MFFLIPLRGSGVDGDHEIVTGLVSGSFDSCNNEGKSVLVLLKHGGIAAFVAHTGHRDLILLQDDFQRMEDLCAPAKSFLPASCGNGHNHELLDVHIIGSVSAAVEDVHHGNGEGLCIHTAHIAVQADTLGCSCSFGTGEGYTQNGIGTQSALVGGSVQIHHNLIDAGLLQYIFADQGRGDFAADILHCLGNTLSKITALIPVPKLMCFVNAGGSAGGNRGPADDPALQNHFHFNSGVSTGIQNFSTNDILNDMILFHGNLSYVNYKTISKVPAAIRAQPAMDLGVNCSCRISAASIIVITTLSLSMGTTLEASPN